MPPEMAQSCAPAMIMAAAKLVEVIDEPQNRLSVTPPALMS